jgi:hypothetical protein
MVRTCTGFDEDSKGSERMEKKVRDREEEIGKRAFQSPENGRLKLESLSEESNYFCAYQITNFSF